MTTATRLDLLILYNGNTAWSAASKTKQPFPLKSINNPCNIAYSYFLDYCRSIGFNAGFSTSSDIIGPGLCSSYWIYQGNTWQKVNKPCQSNVVYDKFSPKNEADLSRQSLFFSRGIKRYNSEQISQIFFDKNNTHSSLLSHTIPTVAITKPTLSAIKLATTLLTGLAKTGILAGDFGQDFILKDRYGAGGWHVYKISSVNSTKEIQKVMYANQKTSFILQPFALFDRGFVYDNAAVPTDIRMIYLGGQFLFSYLRFPKSGDFRCNEHQGGSSVYIKESEIPLNIKVKADLIADSLKTKALIALDFIVTNSGTPYLIEGNTGPGLSWDQNNKKEVFKGKKLIRGIVDQLAGRIGVSKTNSNNNSTRPNRYTPTALSILQSV
ncbi:hypothetical protein KBD69_03015 [Candidatus Woesebacteria bacterium]|nr:hypothetical protein [Candidatus Woesebacteria bacterium]